MQLGMNVSRTDCGKGVTVEVALLPVEPLEMIARLAGATAHNYFGERRCECGILTMVTVTVTHMAKGAGDGDYGD